MQESQKCTYDETTMRIGNGKEVGGKGGEKEKEKKRDGKRNDERVG